jgi:hypothetical protein
MLFGTLFAILISALSDPDSGFIQSLPFAASTVATIVILLKSILYVGILHCSRKALLDYFDMEVYAVKALETSEGAGKAMTAVAIIMVAIAIVIFAATH